jgi:hypothetical protein
MRTWWLGIVVAGLAVGAAPANAEMSPELVKAQPESMAASDIRQQGATELDFRERELEIASEMVFVTSRSPMLGVPELNFTDLGLWRTQAAIVPLESLRVRASATFVPKQPATVDEPFWQSAGVGADLGIAMGIALVAEGGVGHLLAGRGYFGTAALGAKLRTIMSDHVIWEGRLTASANHLWFTGDLDTRSWFAEVGASGEMQLCWGRCARRDGATWVGIDLGVPVYDHARARDPASPAVLDPRTRLGFSLGSFGQITDTWDVYGTVAWVDRGDPTVPATQLPILDGGFDQVQIAFGVIAHWPLWSRPLVPVRDDYGDYPVE